MDTVTSLNNLARRRTCYYDAFGVYRCRSSSWSGWGRWLLVGLIIFFFVSFIFCACLTSRRRRARGAKPIYGTGWMPMTGNQQANNNNYQPPPPQYGAPQQENYNYGPGQESGYVPPQAPKPAYNGAGGYDMPQYGNNGVGANNSYYTPPTGPPPGQYSK